MPLTYIFYSIRSHPEEVKVVSGPNPSEDTEIIVEEEIQHSNYNDLRNKIKERSKQLPELSHKPLYDLHCTYTIPQTPTTPAREINCTNLTQTIYDSIEWDSPSTDAVFEAIFYTLQGTDGDSSFDSLNTTGNSGTSLDCVLQQLEHIIAKLCRVPPLFAWR